MWLKLYGNYQTPTFNDEARRQCVGISIERSSGMMHYSRRCKWHFHTVWSLVKVIASVSLSYTNILPRSRITRDIEREGGTSNIVVPAIVWVINVLTNVVMAIRIVPAVAICRAIFHTWF